ncbi:MAG: class IV adenylate cyclase [Rickettsiales bacterium]|jgi:adenylate cyclase class 2|nr:class IV adenylate cyclase [Rickettsiales bacterium]
MEIETKHRVHDLSKLKEALEKQGFRYEKTKRQIDRYYIPRAYDDRVETVWPILPDMVGNVRLRETDGKTQSLDLKYIGVDVDESDARKITEFEVAIADAGSLANATKILDLLGFAEICVIDKTREIWRFEEVEACLDSVANLGDFIELEIMSDDKDLAAARLVSLGAALGLSDSDKLKWGYNELLKGRKK